MLDRDAERRPETGLASDRARCRLVHVPVDFGGGGRRGRRGALVELLELLGNAAAPRFALGAAGGEGAVVVHRRRRFPCLAHLQS